MNELGKPTHFDLEAFYKTIDGMINSDEIERALLMLDNMPGYYRAYPPERAEKMREALHAVTWTPTQYVGIYDKIVNGPFDIKSWPLRADILEKTIKDDNQNGIIPNLMELAPGAFWLPHGLKNKGCRFTYECLSLDKHEPPFDKPNGNGKNIFVAFELIEHLSNEWEIYQNYLKFNHPANMVLLSTPHHTYGGGMDKWESRELGHLRTYTVEEFHLIASKMFQGFRWSCNLGDGTIVLTGVRK